MPALKHEFRIINRNEFAFSKYWNNLRPQKIYDLNNFLESELFIAELKTAYTFEQGFMKRPCNIKLKNALVIHGVLYVTF